MIRALIAFLVLLGAVFLGLQINNDPGYVLVAFNHWTIETTLWVAVFAIVLLFLLLHIAIQVVHKIARTPGSISRWHSRHLAHKAQETTRKGLIEYSEGYWLKARNHLIQALPNTDTPLLNYLTAARAAQKMGDSTLRDHYLREAQQSMPEAKIAVELTQAQLQLANHQWEQALATLRHLQDLAPRHPYVLKLLMYLYQEVRDWTQLIELLPALKKNHVISHDDYLALQKNTYVQALHDLGRQNQAAAMTDLFNSLPKSLNLEPELVAEYVRFLLKIEDYKQAETILRRALRNEFSVELIELYSHLPCDENHLLFAESFLKKHPHSAPLHLSIGRICIGQHLWGKAKTHLEQSIDLIPTPIAYAELGRLQERLNDPLMAGISYKKGLELMTKSTNLM